MAERIEEPTREDREAESVAAAAYQSGLTEDTCRNLLEQGWVLQIDKVTGPRWLAPPHLDWNKPSDGNTELTAVSYGELMTRDITLAPEQRPNGWEYYPGSTVGM